jgi:hypothetical protein
VKSAISDSNSALRGSRPVSAVSTGAPTATPRAYRLTSMPADGTLMCRSVAMVGISPTITNSVVPMANALRVSANRAMGMVCLQKMG